jgi:hypothetical protein
VRGQLLAEQGQVVLLEGGGGEGRFRVEQPRELGDDRLALFQQLLDLLLRLALVIAGLRRDVGDGGEL